MTRKGVRKSVPPDFWKGRLDSARELLADLDDFAEWVEGLLPR